jgi:hypothetical protein
LKLRASGTMRGGLRTLLASLVALLVVFPVIDEGLIGRGVFVVLSTVVVLSGAYAASMDRHRLATALLLAMPALASRWSQVFVPTTPIRAAALVTSLVFYVYTIVLVLQYVLRTDDVTPDEIFGAVSVYILVGLAWGMGFSFLELLAPGSIYSVKGALVPGDFLYFSFITLMTVGYGDMYPVSPVARSMAIVEAMVGIIFVAVLISRLVGLHAGRPRRT